MNNGFEIRNASLDDVDEIIKITGEAFNKYRELAKTHFPLPALEETREQVTEDIKNKLVLVAYINGKVVGRPTRELTEQERKENSDLL